MTAGSRNMSCHGFNVPTRETLAIHVELQQLLSFWAGDQAHVASTGPSCPKPGQLNLVVVADLAVHGL